MDSIFFLVGAIVLNLVLKSAQDKRRAEEARHKRMSQSPNSQTEKTKAETKRKQEKQPSLFQELITIFNEEIEKKTQAGRDPKPISRPKERVESKKQFKSPAYQKEEWAGSQAKVTESAYKDFSPEHYSRGGNRDLDEEARLEAGARQRKKEELKKDIVRGLIFSEILSEPKGSRRGM